MRTVRRYITHLQDIGIPIEASIGRHGGYRLRPGFKLPPLMFTEEEATAVMLGLLGTSWLEIGQTAAATEGALAEGGAYYRSTHENVSPPCLRMWPLLPPSMHHGLTFLF